MNLIKYTISVLCLCQGLSAFAQDSNNNTTSNDSSDQHHLSKGGLFLEPILSVSKEQSEIKTSQLPLISDDTSGNSNAMGVGLRLGVHVSEILFLAADARYEKIHFSDSTYGTADGTAYNLGPVIGVQMPFFGLRVWGGYVAMGESDPGSGNSGFDAKFKDARGPRIGVGIHLASVSLNLEQEDLTYNNTEIQSYGIIKAKGDSSVDFNGRATTLSVSFPVEL